MPHPMSRYVEPTQLTILACVMGSRRRRPAAWLLTGLRSSRRGGGVGWTLVRLMIRGGGKIAPRIQPAAKHGPTPIYREGWGLIFVEPHGPHVSGAGRGFETEEPARSSDKGDYISNTGWGKVSRRHHAK